MLSHKSSVPLGVQGCPGRRQNRVLSTPRRRRPKPSLSWSPRTKQSATPTGKNRRDTELHQPGVDSSAPASSARLPIMNVKKMRDHRKVGQSLIFQPVPIFRTTGCVKRVTALANLLRRDHDGQELPHAGRQPTSRATVLHLDQVTKSSPIL